MLSPSLPRRVSLGWNGGAHGVVGQHARRDEASSASEGSEGLGDHHGEVDDMGMDQYLLIPFLVG